ncbi:LOW QUALITY PROTEIN: F-box only protein 46 [Coturnix japonica]|uniref:LOW QUALITY PROTEIN: F-box only protein 46 n=1 Tax=Coturnix japonica TaxID=93934 RepID=UPI0013A5D923|nr:LOW QUALITY PROTEIN: F-box only protein 46 [Coturnix japonica]
MSRPRPYPQTMSTPRRPPGSHRTLGEHPPSLPNAPTEEGRVLLDTWYVIKPGNTKEKVAFFVAHQWGGSSGNRANAMKIKGNWGSESSKAKRRRRCHQPGKIHQHEIGDGVDNPDPLSVAEMVALVEQRAALAVQSLIEVNGDAKTPPVTSGGADCNRVAEAVAQFESRQRAGGRHNGLCQPNGDPMNNTTATTTATATPGEVRIAFRISSARDGRAGTGSGEGTSAGGRPGCMYMGGSGGTRSKDKITCDLYQLISPSRDQLPTNVEFLLANATPDGGADSTASCGEGETGSNKTDGAEGVGGGGESTTTRDCVSGFHVDVVVTGVVDQCVFFGKDSAKKVKEETVRLAAPQEEPPPPGQLFLLPGAEDTKPNGSGLEVKDEASSTNTNDPSLCRLYRHVSHDFLEIRFKIQRLLEPRQYMLLLPEHVMVKIFSYLPTQTLAALKCSCHYFKSIIETFGVQATDSRWNRDPLYREDPCKQCKKKYVKGDVSLCRWHPKPYHHDLPYGRSYWMCCRRPDKEAPGCRVGLHDNNWVHPAARRDEGR